MFSISSDIHCQKALVYDLIQLQLFNFFSSFVKFVFKILFRQLIFHPTSQLQSSPLFIEFDYNWELCMASRETSYWESIIAVQSTTAWSLCLSWFFCLQRKYWIWKTFTQRKEDNYIKTKMVIHNVILTVHVQLYVNFG